MTSEAGVCYGAGTLVHFRRTWGFIQIKMISQWRFVEEEQKNLMCVYGMILTAVLGIDHTEKKTAAERAIRRLAKKARQWVMMAQAGGFVGGGRILEKFLM